MKRIVSLLLTLVLVLSLVACGDGDTSTPGGSASTGGASTSAPAIGSGVTSTPPVSDEVEYAKELTLAITLSDLHPNNGWSATKESYHRFVFDTLVYHNDMTGEVTMQLAKSVEWDNDDCTRLHVILRDDIVFSNGDPVTAEDVDYCLGRATYSSVTNFYDSCEVISDTELYINLKKPCTGFIAVLSRSCAAIYSKAAAEAHPENLGLIGSGPYMYDMDTHVAKASITLVRNEKFWGEEINPTEKIHINTIADASARAIALQNGDIQYANSLNSAEIPNLKADKNLAVTEYTSTNFCYMGFNDLRDSDNLTDEEIAFRRAVACAINKEEVMLAFGDVNGQPMVSMWPFNDTEAYLDSESDYPTDLSYNPENAKAWLAKAGGKTEVTCLVDTSKAHCKLAGQVVQEQLRQVGITMIIEETDSTGFSAASKYDSATYEMWCWSNLFIMPTVNWNYFMEGSGVNKALIASDAITTALDTIAASDDKAVETENLKIIQTEVHENVSYIPLWWRELNFATAVGVEGVEYTTAPCWNFRNIRMVVSK